MMRLLPQQPSTRRALLIGILTLVVGSAVLTPHLNPFTRGAIFGAQGISLVWGELSSWRMAIYEETAWQGQWPQDIQSIAPEQAGRYTEVSSPAPYQLVVTVKDMDEMGSLAGRQVILEFTPDLANYRCRGGEPPIPQRYLPLNCQDGDVESPLVSNLRWLALICLLVGIGCAILLLLRHPLLTPLYAQPANLLRTPYGRLARLDFLLRILLRRQTTLQAAGVTLASWGLALAYARADDEQRVRSLALRLGASCKPSTGWALPGSVYEWQFNASLPVSLDRCLVYVPPAGSDALAVVQQLRALRNGLDVCLVLAHDPGAELGAFCADTANLFVLLGGADQSEWILGRRCVDVLLRCLSSQLRVTRISPYQTRGGVARSSLFFGRENLLARVLNREPANYLVVGGRQLGKSSLLKAVQRRLEGHPQVVCHYISLRDHRLAPRLALQFGLEASTPLERVIEHIVASHSGKRVFLLIDEADPFFRDEAANDYVQLSTLRALSEEGRCWFMLAGFWDLYASAVLDYQSPLRNFGEVLNIGALEEAACGELASVPLRQLRLGFASDALVAEVVRASGQRANLVAIICQECLEALEPGARVIEGRHLQRALASQAVQDAMAGWGRLSNDENACQLDRIIVYYIALNGSISFAALIELFERQAVRVEIRALEQSFSRLVLAFVLRRNGHRYHFAIPLFALQFEPQELPVLLAQELQQWRGSS